MKKIFFLFLLILFIIPFVFAEVSITTDQETYNLGNKLKVSASVLWSNNLEGLLKLTIVCGEYKLNYFLTPISLEANFRTAIDAPELTVASSMLGNCSIESELTSIDNLVIEQKESNSFTVTKQLTVLPVKNKIISLPGDPLQISGIVNEAFGNNVLKASVGIKLDNSTYTIDAIDGKFNFTFEISKTIKSGSHVISAVASDAKGNSGEADFELEVIAVPKYIKNDLSQENILPGTKINITASLFDQADDVISTPLDLQLASPKGNKLFEKNVESGTNIDYEFSQYAEPGIYVLTGSYKNLISKSFINVSTVREVQIKYQNETVLIENIGNVPFIDKLVFILENELKKYNVERNVNIEPGKSINLDLSQEMPLGTYSIKVPTKEGILIIAENISQSIQNAISSVKEEVSNILSGQESILAADVLIHDNRPVYKKIASGFSSITGVLIGADGILAKNPVLAPMILVIILVLVVFRYGRKPIMKIFKRKKDDDKGSEI